MAITQNILPTIFILLACFKYFTRTPVLCGDTRDQRLLWFCQEQTILILLFLFTIPVMASPQIGRVESKEYYSWMRGHHASKDIFETVIGTTLSLQREPENAKDPHAVAFVEDTGRIVGHIPLGLSRTVSSFLKIAKAEICGEWINREAGLGLEIPVIYKIYGGRKYVDRLDEHIHGSETAKRAAREKDEGILIDGRKKRKSTKKDKNNIKKQKK